VARVMFVMGAELNASRKAGRRLSSRTMADKELKGWMGGNLKFGVGEDLSGVPEAKGPLLPLRLVVVSDLIPNDPFNAGASPPENALRIDPARFDDLFTKLRPRIAIEVPSVLHGARNTRVDLSPTSLKSFRPDGLCAEVPLLRSLLDARMVLERLREGQLSAAMAESELERLFNGSPFAREVLGLIPAPQKSAPAAEPPPAAEPQGGGTSIDALLDMVELPGQSSSSSAQPAPSPQPAAAQVPSKFSELIANVAMSARPSGGGALNAGEAIRRIEKALGAQIGAILQHPEVRRIEQAWRGLRMLVERAQNHSGIRIDVVSARQSEMASALTRAIRSNASIDPPVSCAIVDMRVDGSAHAWSRLGEIAKVAEDHTVPVIVNGSAQLFGMPSLSGVEKLDYKGGLFEAPEQLAWRSAAKNPSLRWVTIAMNGVLSRAPYDKSTSRVREAIIKELPNDEGAFVWLEPAYAVGTLVLESFRATGWPCRIVGARSGGVVENLPVHEVKDGYADHEGIAIPTEAFISTDTQRELAKLGLLVLASAPNSDAVYVLNAPTAYVTPPKRTYDSASTEPEERYEKVSLVDQLFVARFVQFLRALCSKLPPSSDPAEVQPVVEGALWMLFENAAPASIELQVKAHAHQEGTAVEVDLRPRRFLGVALDGISLEMPLG